MTKPKLCQRFLQNDQSRCYQGLITYLWYSIKEETFYRPQKKKLVKHHQNGKASKKWLKNGSHQF